MIHTTKCYILQSSMIRIFVEIRVLYLDLEDEALTYLLVLLNKTDAEDISSDEKRIIRRLVQTIKMEVRQ